MTDIRFAIVSAIRARQWGPRELSRQADISLSLAAQLCRDECTRMDLDNLRKLLQALDLRVIAE